MKTLPKYRAWHKKTKQMYEVVGIRWFSDRAVLLKDKTFEKIGVDDWYHAVKLKDVDLVYWTGLQDVKGRDVDAKTNVV